MANFREYGARIRQLQNMRRITMAMKMISTTKLSRAQEQMEQAHEFTAEWRKMLEMIVHSRNREHPLLKPREKPESAFVLLVTSDMGLCGGFNNNLLRMVRDWLEGEAKKYRILRFGFCGRKGYQFGRDRVEVRAYYENAVKRPDVELASRIGREIFTTFAEGKYDEIYLARNRFFTPLWQEPVLEKLLPFDVDTLHEEETGPKVEILMEPPGAELLYHLLSLHVCQRVYSALTENASGEHAARMTAMDSASKNIDSLCGQYTLLRNRARQAAITTELIEVVSGAEALH